jgi:hypothetical protein
LPVQAFKPTLEFTSARRGGDSRGGASCHERRGGQQQADDERDGGKVGPMSTQGKPSNLEQGGTSCDPEAAKTRLQPVGASCKAVRNSAAAAMGGFAAQRTIYDSVSEHKLAAWSAVPGGATEP